MGSTGALELLPHARAASAPQSARVPGTTLAIINDLKMSCFSVPCETKPIRNPQKSLW